MLSPRGILSLSLGALLCTSALGAPQYETNIRQRQDFLLGESKGSLGVLPRQDQPAADPSAPEAPTALLEPVIPPVVDEDALSVLKLAKNITLAWAGSSSTNVTNGKFKRDGDAVLSQAQFTFRYPTVALDHSSFVSGVSCSAGKLTGKLSATAYAYAKKQWASAGQIIFITSVDGCGSDAANDYFLAKTIGFSDSKKTFTANGAGSNYGQLASHFKLDWGNVGAYNLKRSHTKREVRLLCRHVLHVRKC